MENKGSKVNIKKIAEDLGVSATTVSRVLSGNGRIGQATIDRIHNYLKENGLEPNVYAKDVSKKRTNLICVTIPLEEDYAELPFFQKILLSLYDYFSLYGYRVFFIKTTWTDISALENVVKNRLADGVVLTRTITNGIDIKLLQESGMPFVVTGSYDDRSVSQVDVDQLNGCCDLTTALLRMGIRNMALLMAEKTHVVNVSRYKGFDKAHTLCGLETNQNLIFDNAGHASTAESLTEELVKQGVECILCMDDNICLYVLNALRKLHVEVPRDIKVASFYNSRPLNDFYPSISCVEFDIHELGCIAGKVLLERLNGDLEPQQIMLGYKVILKDSTK